jgi:transposase-like protein
MSDEDFDNTDEPINIPDAMARELSHLVENYFTKKEREDAWELIRHSFNMLPMELQDLYQDVMQLYRAGKHEEASKLFEQWMEDARDMGLI